MSEPSKTVAARPERRVGRGLAATTLVAACAALIAFSDRIRALEALASEPLIGRVTGQGTTTTLGDAVYFGLGTTAATGIRITPGCTTVVLVIPFLVVLTAVAALSSVALRRVAAASVVGTLLLVLVNLLRLGLIAWATHRWGPDRGFEVSHLLVGSLLAIAGFALTMMLSVRILVGRVSGRQPVR